MWHTNLAVVCAQGSCSFRAPLQYEQDDDRETSMRAAAAYIAVLGAISHPSKRFGREEAWLDAHKYVFLGYFQVVSRVIQTRPPSTWSYLSSIVSVLYHTGNLPMRTVPPQSLGHDAEALITAGKSSGMERFQSWVAAAASEAGEGMRQSGPGQRKGLTLKQSLLVRVALETRREATLVDPLTPLSATGNTLHVPLVSISSGSRCWSACIDGGHGGA